MTTTQTPEQSLSRWWRRGALAVLLAGFSVLVTMTVLTYRKAPPIPDRVVDPSGAVVFTGDDIGHGQEIFLKYGLM
jgi:nitric oxide reductase subunit B